jgi:hypothetical protein
VWGRRDLPKQTGAPYRAHVTFVAFAYIPVFKDRAETEEPEGSFSARECLRPKRRLAAPRFILQGGGTLRRLPPGRQPLFSGSSPRRLRRLVSNERAAFSVALAPQLPEPPSGRGGLVLQAYPDRQPLSFFRLISLP